MRTHPCSYLGNPMRRTAATTLLSFLLLVSWTTIPDAKGAFGAQDSLRFALRVEDAGGTWNTLTIGFHPEGTLDYDHALGEFPIPPMPSVAAFDARFLDPPSLTRFPSTGSYSDIRGLDAAVDTFRIHIQPQNDAFPVTLTWSHREACAFARATLYVRRSGTWETTDMAKVSTLELSAEGTQPLFVIIDRKKEGQ